MRYFEDFAVGDEWAFSPWVVSQEEAFDFAREYDPQPIHLDADMARTTHFEVPIVSGWQTLMKSVRHFIDGVMKNTAGLASPGVDEIRWLQPLLPQQTMTSGARVLDIKASKSRPDRGLVWFEIYAKNEAGEKTMTSKGVFFIAKKPAGSVT